jgi:5-hydroxyisourate hydrolase
MGISTHILDTSKGRPAKGVTVRLEQVVGMATTELAQGVTNDDGRVKPLLDTIPMKGTFRLVFEVAPYFAAQGIDTFYPSVAIDFVVKDVGEHYHVPLLLNPFGFSTYRGS